MKAEFDSLKNDFQTQINQYNTSIDNKIDGAIATYLAGIKVSKETKYTVETADWLKVDAINYVLPQSWKIPNLNLTFNYDFSGPNPSGTWYECYAATAGISYERPSSQKQLRNCVDAGSESATYSLPDAVVWRGQSKDYIEKITATKVGKLKNRTESDLNGYVTGATFLPAYFDVIYALNFAGGYMPNALPNEKWTAQLNWYTEQTKTNRTMSDEYMQIWFSRDVSTSISLASIDGSQYQYEHIMNYDNYDWSNLSDPNWSNSLGDNPGWTKESVLTNSSVTKNGFYSIVEMYDNTRTDGTEYDWQHNVKAYDGSNIGNVRYGIPTGNFHAYYTGGVGASDTASIKSVGALNKTYASDKIYQWSGKKKLKRDDTIEVENINLYNGLLIGYAKKEEKFKWEPKITGSYKDGTSNMPIEKWRVELSKTPFGVKDTVASVDDVLKNKDQTNDYLVTNTSGTCKFNIDIESDTVIYCKWWPDDTMIRDTKEWIGTLDLTACGTYVISQND